MCTFPSDFIALKPIMCEIHVNSAEKRVLAHLTVVLAEKRV